MDNDLKLVLGIVIFALSIPSLISAFSESRPPRMAAIFFVVGGALIVWSVQGRPGNLVLSDIPHAFARVIGRFIN